jgi:hypothetical protein
MFLLVAATIITGSSLALLNQASAQPCPADCANCKAEIVYVYMIHDSKADKPERSWLGIDALDLVYWTTQERAWVTTRRAEAENKRSSLLSKRGRRSTIRKFFLMESKK